MNFLEVVKFQLFEEDNYPRLTSNRKLDKIAKYPWKLRNLPPLGIRGPLMIEILGLPDSGKSTVLQDLRDNPIPGIQLTIIPEIQIRLSTGQVINRRNLRNSRSLGLEYESSLLETTKLAALEQRVIEDEGTSNVILQERGPLDVLAHLYRILYWQLGKTHLPDSDKEQLLSRQKTFNSQTEIFPGVDDMQQKLLVYALDWAAKINAAIFFNVSQLNHQERNKKSLINEGITDQSWSKLEDAYGWLIGSLLPIFRMHHGTGVLIVDGNKPAHKNNSRVRDYIEKLWID